MADANEVIRRLGFQLAQALIDKTIAEVDVAEARAALAAAGGVESDRTPIEPVEA